MATLALGCLLNGAMDAMLPEISSWPGQLDPTEGVDSQPPSILAYREELLPEMSTSFRASAADEAMRKSSLEVGTLRSR